MAGLQAGRLLAHVLMAGAHGDRPVTLVGYSMGARLVFHTLLELTRNNCKGVLRACSSQCHHLCAALELTLCVIVSFCGLEIKDVLPTLLTSHAGQGANFAAAMMLTEHSPASACEQLVDCLRALLC